MSFLSLSNLSKLYGNQYAVADLSIDVEKGEFVTLLGPSGCGKTTTLQMIAGFAEVSSGEIMLDGRDITHAKPHERGLGIVFQSYALFPHMTVHDNVSFGLEMRRMPKVEREERIRSALSLVHLDSFADRYPRELSGGQRQRVALARALVIEPPVLLLDEPLSNLDAKLREEMQFELRKIQRKVGTTTIMVTHDQSEAMSISDRIVVMQSGRVTQVDAPYRLYDQPRSKFISSFVGKANLLSGHIRKSDMGFKFDICQMNLDVPYMSVDEGKAITLSLRPEKISFIRAGQGQLDGVVTARYFLGDQWIYYLNTQIGELVVVTPNDDSEPLEESTRSGLTWSSSSLRLLTESSPQQ
jgi:putative spermidine/putrescine transport system ATP-binding protein